MEQFIIDAKVKDGYLSLTNLPFKEDTEVKVILIPKIKFAELSFLKVRELTSSIKGNISDDIIKERNDE